MDLEKNLLEVDFGKDKYITVKQGLHPDVAALIAQYSIFQAFQNLTVESEDGMVPNTHAVYGDPLMESLLNSLKPVVEEATGLSLFPTYSYYRLYKPGDELHPHTDRPANEITATVNFGSQYIHVDPAYSWPICVDGVQVTQNPGDMFIYRGTEITHWRTPLEGESGSWHAQAFLGYVNADGPYSFCRYDSRPNLGYSQSSRNADHMDFALELMQKNKEAKLQSPEPIIYLQNV